MADIIPINLKKNKKNEVVTKKELPKKDSESQESSKKDLIEKKVIKKAKDKENQDKPSLEPTKAKLDDENNSKDDVKDDVNDDDNTQNVDIKTGFDAYEFYKTYDPAKNVFNNVLFKYEFTACLGLRATQISEGCPVLVDVPEGIESPEEIAIMEMKAGKCPLIICREGREYWRVCDLINPYLENY
jgi:DNA-directed RNA polymerase subunit K/omega